MSSSSGTAPMISSSFARSGELASNRHEDHEVSMLALHLLQNCMIYVNTLTLQQVLAHPDWRQKLEPRDLSALTPLIWEHVNRSPGGNVCAIEHPPCNGESYQLL